MVKGAFHIDIGRSYAIKTQRKARNGFGCLELCLYKRAGVSNTSDFEWTSLLLRNCCVCLFYLPRLLAGLAKGGREMVELAEKFPQNSSVSSSRLEARLLPPVFNPQISAKAISLNKICK